MPWYATHYSADFLGSPVRQPGRPTQGEFGTVIWARNTHDAEVICHQRGLGERVYSVSRKRALPRPEPRPSDLLRKRKMTPKQRVDAIHAAGVSLRDLGYGAGQTGVGSPWRPRRHP